MSDEDPATVGVTALNERHLVLGVLIGVLIVDPQTSGQPLEFGFAVGGPHEVLNSE